MMSCLNIRVRRDLFNDAKECFEYLEDENLSEVLPSSQESSRDDADSGAGNQHQKHDEKIDHSNIDIQSSLPNSSFRGIYDSETCTGFAPDLHFI